MLQDILVVSGDGLHTSPLCSPSCANCLGISVSISPAESGRAGLQQRVRCQIGGRVAEEIASLTTSDALCLPNLAGDNVCSS